MALGAGRIQERIYLAPGRIALTRCSSGERVNVRGLTDPLVRLVSAGLGLEPIGGNSVFLRDKVLCPSAGMKTTVGSCLWIVVKKSMRWTQTQQCVNGVNVLS